MRSKFTSSSVWSFSENSRRHRRKKKKNTQRELHEIKIYRVFGYNWEKKISNAIDHFLKVGKRRKKSILLFKKKRKKKSPSQIVVNGYVLCLFFFFFFWFSASNPFKQKQKKKKGVLPPPQSHTLSIILCRGEGRTRNKYIHHWQ